ncbi:hypothetical protein [Gymnodinialimonas sp.]
MNSRTIIRANGSIAASVIVTMVFGGLAVFGLRIVFVALGLGETGLWVWALLGIALLLLWAVVHVLWSAFGVALIISRGGIRKPGPFRGITLPAQGLRLGRYDTLRMGAITTSGDKRARKVSELWALCPQRGAVLLMETARDAPVLARVAQGAGLHLGLEVEEMSRQGAAGFAPRQP